MTPQDALVWITIFGAIGTAINIYISLYVAYKIGGLKLWAIEKFVSKEDVSTFLAPIKDGIQAVGSMRRLAGLDKAERG